MADGTLDFVEETEAPPPLDFVEEPALAARPQPTAPASRPAYAGPTATDAFVSHVGHGAGFGTSDTMQGVGASLAEKSDPLTRISRGIGGKPTGETAYSAAYRGRQSELAEQEAAQPVASGLGTAVGVGAVTAPFSIAAMPTATGALVAEGALATGALAAGESEAQDPVSMATDVAPQAAVGGMANAMLPGAANLAARGVNKLGGLARNSGAGRRLASWGAYGSDVRALAQAKGRDSVERIASRGEDMGLGGLRSWHQTEKQALPLVEQKGAEIAGLHEAAERVGVRVNLGPIADTLESQAKQLRRTSNLPDMIREADELESFAAGLRSQGRRITPQQAASRAERAVNKAVEEGNAIIESARGGGKEAEDAALAEAQRLFSEAETRGARMMHRAEYPDEVPFSTAHELRRWLDGKVWQNRKATLSDPNAGQKAEQYRAIASDLRGRIGEGLDGAGATDVREALSSANADYEAAAFALDAATKRTMREAGNWPVSPVSAITGSTAGGMGLASGDPSALGYAAATAAATEAAKRYGNSAVATGLRGGGDALQSLARPMVPASRAVTGTARRGAVAAASPEPSAGMSISPADALAIIEGDPNAFGPNTQAVKAAAEAGDVERMQMAMVARR